MNISQGQIEHIAALTLEEAERELDGTELAAFHHVWATYSGRFGDYRHFQIVPGTLPDAEELATRITAVLDSPAWQAERDARQRLSQARSANRR